MSLNFLEELQSLLSEIALIKQGLYEEDVKNSPQKQKTGVQKRKGM